MLELQVKNIELARPEEKKLRLESQMSNNDGPCLVV